VILRRGTVEAFNRVKKRSISSSRGQVDSLGDTQSSPVSRERGKEGEARPVTGRGKKEKGGNRLVIKSRDKGNNIHDTSKGKREGTTGVPENRGRSSPMKKRHGFPTGSTQTGRYSPKKKIPVTAYSVKKKKKSGRLAEDHGANTRWGRSGECHHRKKKDRTKSGVVSRLTAET